MTSSEEKQAHNSIIFSETVPPTPVPEPLSFKHYLNIIPKEPLELEFNQRNKFTIELTAKERLLDFEEKVNFLTLL